MLRAAVMRPLLVSIAVHAALAGVLFAVRSHIAVVAPPPAPHGETVEFELEPVPNDRSPVPNGPRAVPNERSPVPNGRAAVPSGSPPVPRRSAAVPSRSVAVPSVSPAVPTAPVPEPPPVVAPPPPVARPALTASSLLLAMHSDVSRLDSLVLPSTPPGTGATALSDAERLEQASAHARDVVQTHVREVMAESTVSEQAGAHAQNLALARRMRETWRPIAYHTPDMFAALVAMPTAMARGIRRFSERASQYGSVGRVTTREEDEQHNAFMGDFEERSIGTMRTTITVVEVTQDDSGHVTGVNVVRGARVHAFDDAAVQAVREGLANQAPVATPGGRRSRFSFEVMASRDAIAPIAGFQFDEVTGFFQVHLPGQLHVRARVRSLGSRASGTQWRAPRPVPAS